MSWEVGKIKKMRTTKNIIPTNQTQRDNFDDPFCVFINQELVFFSSFATMLNLLQKSSPLWPRLGTKLSSEPPRMIVSPVYFISLGAGDLAGRAKTGVIGVIGGWRGCGALGTDGRGEGVS
jgi:hypothetical protein